MCGRLFVTRMTTLATAITTFLVNLFDSFPEDQHAASTSFADGQGQLRILEVDYFLDISWVDKRYKC